MCTKICFWTLVKKTSERNAVQELEYAKRNRLERCFMDETYHGRMDKSRREPDRDFARVIIKEIKPSDYIEGEILRFSQKTIKIVSFIRTKKCDEN